MSEHEAAALVARTLDEIAVRPAPEFGPLVRSQALRPRDGSSTVPWVALGAGSAKLGHTLLGGELTELVVLGSLVTAGVLAEQAPGWWRSLRIARCPTWDGTDPPPGGAVKVSGTVRAVGEPFTIPGEDEPVIFSHTFHPGARKHGTRGRSRREDVRGLTLEIDLSSGVTVRIAPQAVRLVGREVSVRELGPSVRARLGAPSGGLLKGKLRRRTLRQGDRVEAVGQLVRDVNVQGAASPGRGVPMLHWLVPAWKGGVWIRQVG